MLDDKPPAVPPAGRGLYTGRLSTEGPLVLLKSALRSYEKSAHPHIPELHGWLDYFRNNPQAVDAQPGCLSTDEKRAIGGSIAAFQLGEYSEGHSLMKFARSFAETERADALVEITRMFIREEQNHALLLKDFMARNSIPTIKQTYTDTVFRKLRKRAGYELSITVLITAEIIALTYYRALRQATGHPYLKAICSKILADETAHVAYESTLIRFIRAKHSPLKRRLMRALHRLLLFGTIIVVWREHRKVLLRGGYPFSAFRRSCRGHFSGAGL